MTATRPSRAAYFREYRRRPRPAETVRQVEVWLAIAERYLLCVQCERPFAARVALRHGRRIRLDWLCESAECKKSTQGDAPSPGAVALPLLEELEK